MHPTDRISQLGADDFVLSIFPQPGFFVDVGAADGQVLSNTAKLDALGWHGIALDPLLKNFEGRKNTRTLHAAVYGEANIEVDFAVCPHDPNLSGVASHLTCYRDQVLHDAKVVRLRTRLLADILQEMGAPSTIQYLSLDTEGSEFEILRTFPFHRYSFGVISVEHNFQEPLRQRIRHHLEANSYTLVHSPQWDDWYVHSSLVRQNQNGSHQHQEQNGGGPQQQQQHHC
uniref:Methyltransferase FkbM domain-containing protein n=1 Tax=Dunaliella tertiolecta TaxID=3047 RepID=A0A7S3QPU5_DUNTE|mmetsp:Transcript_13302/g.36052  ORF Transcript_13302/g.36052 Transcript_13302/m.36052 type:complete len:229 (+) Transcript_13302:41-727(+)|eukprot:CAMPEP_0202352014 /NCGR_PEP_ID=MMETSP1126-20121109/8393_1 /ASSEMBLY_ACC=CAM_ASM_000457 /TAXON_ID=3047 /ORGANISM="Dunaliella tertiolecta, Strain CCMP1320" /LENGTH=228 /DNA_ID=CAMNT_0048944175 /DNA_START=27 /DNA_END=713 /DNA_ORIENTATION=+